MPHFYYRALRASGGEIAGELVADDERDAAERLQAQGSYPIVISAAAVRPGRPRRSRERRLPARDLVLFTRQLGALLGSGVALDHALALVADGQGRAAPRILAANLLSAVNRGESLSEACRSQTQFPAHYPMMIAAGEARGNVGAALERLGDVLERSRATSRALLDALIYPTTVLVAAAVSVAFLLGFVVPRFEILLGSLQRGPPPAMQLLLALSAAFQVLALPVALVLLAASLFGVVRYRDPGFRLAMHRRLLRLPMLGSLIARVEAERILYLLGNLVAAGVDLPAALSVTRTATPSEAHRAALAAAEQSIARGDSIAAALGAGGAILPNLATELVRVGEETGDVAPMLLKAGELLRAEFEAASREMIGIITPLSIVFLGLLIGAVAAAILSTIMDVYDFAG